MPAVIIDVRSPHLYTVEFDDGSKRILHANHLRKFYIRAQCVTYDTSLMMSAADRKSCIIRNKQDSDFGEIVTFEGRSENQTKQKLPSQLINRETLAHLSVKQQNELLELLDKYVDCFQIYQV